MLINCINQREIINKRNSLARDYLIEIHSNYNLSPPDADLLNNPYHEYTADSTHHDWVDIKHPETGELVGFLIIKLIPHEHSGSHFYIAEAYIVPKYRNKKIMSKVVSEYVTENPGAYYLYTIKENKGAERFWEKTFAQNGYQRHFFGEHPAFEDIPLYIHIYKN